MGGCRRRACRGPDRRRRVLRRTLADDGSELKVLTVRQPWASLIVAGVKDVENRSWRTNYRGRLGIHAGSRIEQDALEVHGHLLDEDLPLGALIGTVTLVDCVDDSSSSWAIPGDWHWILADAQPLARPRRMPGKLGLWQT
jgi:ASCH domain